MGKAATATIKIETMTIAAIEENMMDVDAIKKGKGMIDTDAIKKEMRIMNTNTIRVKEKSKDVSQQKGEDLNLDCIYDNSSLGFEKPMSSESKRMESRDPLE